MPRLNKVHDEVAAHIYKSTDYDRFENYKGNRILNKHNLGRITASIEEKNMSIDVPITTVRVGDKNIIVNGGHRYRACTDLGLPIYYITASVADMKDVLTPNNMSKSWSADDAVYLYSHVDGTKRQYSQLLKFMNSNEGLSADIAMRICRVQKGTIMSGNFKFPASEKARMERDRKRIEDISMLTSIGTRRYVRSIASHYMRYLSDSNYDHGKLMRGLKKRLGSLKNVFTHSLNGETFKVVVEDILNYSLKEGTKPIELVPYFKNAKKTTITKIVVEES